MGESLFDQAAEGANPPGNAQAKGPCRCWLWRVACAPTEGGKSLRFLTEGRLIDALPWCGFRAW